MPSIAQILIDKEHGIEHEPAPSKPTRVMAPLTEAQIEQRESMRNALRVGVWTVEFVRMNGQMATMECTLDPRLIPESEKPKGSTTPPVKAGHLLHVYSTDRQGWRSFATPNVIKFYKKELE